MNRLPRALLSGALAAAAAAALLRFLRPEGGGLPGLGALGLAGALARLDDDAEGDLSDAEADALLRELGGAFGGDLGDFPDDDDPFGDPDAGFDRPPPAR